MRVCAFWSTSCWTGTVSHSSWAPARLIRLPTPISCVTPGALNEGRDKSDRITYDSLWIHAKRPPVESTEISLRSKSPGSWAKVDPTEAATVVLQIRVGGGVVMDHKPVRR